MEKLTKKFITHIIIFYLLFVLLSIITFVYMAGPPPSGDYFEFIPYALLPTNFFTIAVLILLLPFGICIYVALKNLEILSLRQLLKKNFKYSFWPSFVLSILVWAYALISFALGKGGDGVPWPYALFVFSIGYIILTILISSIYTVVIYYLNKYNLPDFLLLLVVLIVLISFSAYLVIGCGPVNQDSANYICFAKKAATQNNPLICDKLTFRDTHRNKCYIHYAILKKDPSICERYKISIYYGYGSSSLKGCEMKVVNSLAENETCFIRDGYMEKGEFKIYPDCIENIPCPQNPRDLSCSGEQNITCSNNYIHFGIPQYSKICDGRVHK